MKYRILIFILMFAAFGGAFKTGCTPFARAENIMLTQTYSFTIVGDVTLVSISPPDGATNVSRDTTLEAIFTHELPITSIEVVVLVNGEEFVGTQAVSAVPEGVKVVWTPAELLPMRGDVSWTLVVNVDNGL